MGASGCGRILGLALVGKAMLSKTFILLSADGWGCAPSGCLT